MNHTRVNGKYGNTCWGGKTPDSVPGEGRATFVGEPGLADLGPIPRPYAEPAGVKVGSRFDDIPPGWHNPDMVD